MHGVDELDVSRFDDQSRLFVRLPHEAGAQVRVDWFAKDLVGDAAALAVPGPSGLGSGGLWVPPGLRLGGGLVWCEGGVRQLLDSLEAGGVTRRSGR
ncbi:hypothetical protein GCM10010300_81300 [Streptomyces olivaceoviridis]|nr:hypothetical protein GCM10010300_81300 [Streptomyces olivaceoviridis]